MMNSPCCQNSKEHFEKVLNFLKEQNWIYNYPNTHVLVNKVLDNFQQEWLPYLKNIENDELNSLPFGAVNENWPASLNAFIHKIQELKYGIQKWKSTSEIIELPNNNISRKKRHEIVSLAAVIHDICKQQNISFIVDVGAGLGYLSQLLYNRYNYKVLGIEGNQTNLELALKNQKKFYPHSKHFVKYVHHFITENSLTEIETFLKENFSEWDELKSRACIIGLHACADLSVIILNKFVQMDFVKSLIVMPCCYHRLELQHVTATEERFKNFPASNVLTALYNDLKGEIFMKRTFLRLACQQSSGSWRTMSANDHQKHSRSCIFRAIVQEVADKENLDLKRLKRKTGKFKPESDYKIEEYIDNLKYTHELVVKEGFNRDHKIQLIDDAAFKSKIFEKWNEHKENCYLVEVLTAFQTAIQSICENIVLLDRVEFLREKGLECNVYKVTDDRISPRCHALVATKP